MFLLSVPLPPTSLQCISDVIFLRNGATVHSSRFARRVKLFSSGACSPPIFLHSSLSLRLVLQAEGLSSKDWLGLRGPWENMLWSLTSPPWRGHWFFSPFCARPISVCPIKCVRHWRSQEIYSSRGFGSLKITSVFWSPSGSCVELAWTHQPACDRLGELRQVTDYLRDSVPICKRGIALPS